MLEDGFVEKPSKLRSGKRFWQYRRICTARLACLTCSAAVMSCVTALRFGDE